MTVRDDQLAEAASRGDARAAGEFFGSNLRLLRAMAGRLAGGLIDPEDLLSEAMVVVLDRWRRGLPPHRDAVAYVVTVMRNRVIDEARSPRSKVTALPEGDVVEAPLSSEVHEIELYREFDIVTQAFRTLPMDQRQVLQATVIDGRKPGDLVDQLRRPASALYSLNLRAKISLRRATLRLILEQDAPVDCRRAAEALPRVATESVEASPESRGMRHIRSCKRCRAAWARFGALSSAFGLTPILLSATLIAPNAVPPSASSQSGSSRLSRPLVVGAVASIAAGVALIAFSAISLLQDSVGGNDSRAPRSELTVSSMTVNDDAAQLSVTLDVPSDDPTTTTLVISLPSAMSLETAPATWACIVQDGLMTCRIDGGVSGTLLLRDDRARADGTYSIELHSIIAGEEISGSAEGTITGSTLHVTAEAK